ncbi:MAG: hypothetical protein MUF62_10015, partial [Chitinophagaceae bacterium]|nr:hypothetical protein [Chitinophagaceae bacterium]
MQRKQFLLSGLLAGAAVAVSKSGKAGTPPSTSTPFVVPAGKSRFGDSPAFMGLHPNDVKVSGRDTEGQLVMLDYTGKAKMGPPLHIHYHQDEIFTVVHGRYRF